MTDNMRAFLTMLSHSEGTDRAPAPPDGYRTCFGFKHIIQDLRFHPAEHRPGPFLNEWTGERLSDVQCAAVGLSPGCVSTAAGKFQVIRPTWERIKALLHLPDFGPDAQNDCCIQLLKEHGTAPDTAFALVNSGQVAAAINVCHSTWASLPGSQAQQRITSFAALMTSYSNAGGGFA
jgi:muramidase (phage lysozyme)